MMEHGVEDGGRPFGEAVREAAILRSGALFVGDDPRLSAVVERARSRFSTTMAALTIVHGGWQHIIAAVGTTTGTFPRSSSFCAQAILDPAQVMCVPDASLDERFRHTANVVGGDRIRFYAGAPIVSGGQPLGALCVFDPGPRSCLEDDDEQALRSLAADAMAAVDAVARAPRSQA